MRVLFKKIRDVLLSVAPIVGLVLVLSLTLTPFDSDVLIRFFVGVVLVVLGLVLFLFGVDVGIAPIGSLLGSSLAKTNKLIVVILGGFAMGFFISVAEPDLHILANQVSNITSGVLGSIALIIVVSVGVGLLVGIGLLRIVYNIPLRWLLLGSYAVIGLLAFLSEPEFLSIAFDASGATTGALSVPFILALGLGVSKLKKDAKLAEEDSFGLIGLASLGAILTVLIFSVSQANDFVIATSVEVATSPSTSNLYHQFMRVSQDVLFSLLPIVTIFFIINYTTSMLSKRDTRSILFGLGFTFVGLVLFLLGVQSGFMEVGHLVGQSLASYSSSALLIGIGFVLGVASILAEPAVYVLTHQIEQVTSGSIPKGVVVATLALGVGLAMVLSMLRILIPSFALWHVLLPGYVLALGLMFVVPSLFVGIAFDSGGVASGPITATFILAYTQGVAQATPTADVLLDGLGMIALVAMTPLITLQLLGLFYTIKNKKEVHHT